MRDTAGEVNFFWGPLYTYVQVSDNQQKLINNISLRTQDEV